MYQRDKKRTRTSKVYIKITTKAAKTEPKISIMKKMINEIKKIWMKMNKIINKRIKINRTNLNKTSNKNKNRYNKENN